MMNIKNRTSARNPTVYSSMKTDLVCVKETAKCNRLIESIHYLAAKTRPDSCVTVSKLELHVDDLATRQMKRAKHVL